ncbi:MAG: hypothetical protein L3J36_09455 [Rhodobacteraceae bacterium]|nr:hypothetical protein [Paracoccaceae bacterium]
MVIKASPAALVLAKLVLAKLGLAKLPTVSVARGGCTGREYQAQSCNTGAILGLAMQPCVKLIIG